MKLSLIKKYKLKKLSVGYDEIQDLKNNFNQYSKEDRGKIASIIVNNYANLIERQRKIENSRDFFYDFSDYDEMRDIEQDVRKLGLGVSVASLILLGVIVYQLAEGAVKDFTTSAGVSVALFMSALSGFLVYSAGAVSSNRVDAELKVHKYPIRFRQVKKLNEKIDKVNNMLDLAEQVANSKYDKLLKQY